MRTFTLALALILTLSLVFVTGTNHQYSNKALREQLFDYLMKAKRQELENKIKRYQENRFGGDESNDSDEYETINVRGKAVGLGDDPWK